MPDVVAPASANPLDTIPKFCGKFTSKDVCDPLTIMWAINSSALFLKGSKAVSISHLWEERRTALLFRERESLEKIGSLLRTFVGEENSVITTLPFKIP
jgi:hypothetical protein